MSQGLDHEQQVSLSEASGRGNGITELTSNEFALKYSKLGRSQYISAIGPCISPLSADEQFYTGGVYNCVSVSVVKEDGQSLIMHAPPYLAEHFLNKFMDQLIDDNFHIQSVLVSGGAEEGQRIASRVFSEFAELVSDVKWIKPPNEHSSVSVAIDPLNKSIEYAINSYPPSIEARNLLL